MSVVQPKWITYQMAFYVGCNEESLASKHHPTCLSLSIFTVHPSGFVSILWSKDFDYLIFYTQYTYFVLLIIFQESLLKPNTSNINADKLFLIILTSLNCFVSPLCFGLKKKKRFCSRFPYKSESNRLSPSLSSFKDLAVHTTLQWFIWSALITCFRLPACLWENPRMYHGQSVSVSCDDSSRPQVVLSMFEKVLEYIDSNI